MLALVTPHVDEVRGAADAFESRFHDLVWLTDERHDCPIGTGTRIDIENLDVRGCLDRLANRCNNGRITAFTEIWNTFEKFSAHFIAENTASGVPSGDR